MDQTSLKRRIAVADGKEPADLVIKNGKIVNVFSGELMDGDIAIVDGSIAGIGEYEGKEMIDAAGQFISPSFIDGHVHIESAMITPLEFAKILLMHGVTAAIADPHEIANVAGADGIRYMLDASEKLPFDLFFMLPSSVPATKFEHSGARLEIDELAPFLSHPRVLGLAEVMDYQSVLNGEEGMINKILVTLQHKGKIDGHAAGLGKNGINVYTSARIRSDHESVTAEEAMERIRRGMYLMIREGTVAKDLKALLPAVNHHTSRRCLFVTDDKHIDDLLNEGSVDHNVRLAIQHGIEPITAIQMASINAAECFGLTDQGAVAPGYQADLLILDSLDEIKIDRVFKNGRLIVEQGKLIEASFQPARENLAKINQAKDYAHLRNSLHLTAIRKEDLRIELAGSKVHVIEIVPNSLVTNRLVEEAETVEGEFIPSTERDQLKLMVMERHRRTGHIGLGIVKGFKLKRGAIASTVAHDSHNLIAAGCRDEDILIAVEELNRLQGGLVVVDQGKVLAHVSLPIAGLMTDLDAIRLNGKLEHLRKAAETIGASDQFNPFLMLSFLALPVIPHLKLTDQGLFDVDQFKHIPVSVK